MEKVLGIVTYTKPWRMVDESSGEKREGITVEYLMVDKLSPVNNEDGSKGLKFCSESVDLDRSLNIMEVPAMYNLVFSFKVVKGKPSLKLVDLEYVGKFVGKAETKVG